MQRGSSKWVLVFSSLGHAYMHMLTAFFFVLALALERTWSIPYHELVRLWTLGALLVGVAAIPAGWLADRWSAPGMLVLMFFGMGLACFGCALSDTPRALMVGLSFLGLFSAIYHPVGIPWLVRSVTAGGKALGVNGIFGGLGVAFAGTTAGLLVDHMGWRAAFAVPGLACVTTGLMMIWAWRRGLLPEGRQLEPRTGDLGRKGLLRVIIVMMIGMFCLGFIYQACQAAFPKLFDLRLGSLVGEGTLGVGMLVTVVYGVSAIFQVVGGHLADRYSLKWIYLGGFALQVPLLFGLSQISGIPLVAGATLTVLVMTASQPAESMLLSRYSPAAYQGFAFGVKFVLAFGAAPLAISLVSYLFSGAGGGARVFVALAAISLLGAFAVWMLPSDTPRRMAAV
jgi:FSR family fosmidomycin resistance protein-like MFS transporter